MYFCIFIERPEARIKSDDSPRLQSPKAAEAARLPADEPDHSIDFKVTRHTIHLRSTLARSKVSLGRGISTWISISKPERDKESRFPCRRAIHRRSQAEQARGKEHAFVPITRSNPHKESSRSPALTLTPSAPPFALGTHPDTGTERLRRRRTPMPSSYSVSKLMTLGAKLQVRLSKHTTAE